MERMNEEKIHRKHKSENSYLKSKQSLRMQPINKLKIKIINFQIQEQNPISIYYYFNLIFSNKIRSFSFKSVSLSNIDDNDKILYFSISKEKATKQYLPKIIQKPYFIKKRNENAISIVFFFFFKYYFVCSVKSLAEFK